MDQRKASAWQVHAARARSYLVRAGLALLAAFVLMAIAGGSTVESADPTPTPSPSPTKTATAEPIEVPTKAPTRVPTATPSPTPVPAQDLAVVFFNNFCDRDQPLMATIFNTSATPLNGRTVRLRLSSESGILEEHDHYLDLGPLASVNLPLASTARPPWVKIELELLETPADPNPGNDSSSCGVPGPEAAQPEAQPTRAPGGRAPSISGGAGGDSTLRQAAASPTPRPAVVPTRAVSRVQTNNPQPSLTPIGDAGGGLAPPSQGGLLASRTLMLAGVVLLAGGSSWAFYYLTRPPKNA